MKKGFRYWWEDHKRAVLLALLLGFLFDIANLGIIGRFYEGTLDSIGAWLALLAVCIVVGGIGLLKMALTTWLCSLILLFAQLISDVGLFILGKKDSTDASSRSEGAGRAAAGLAVAYWIGYRFYLTWIK